jgi:hypothetical protein
MKKDDSQVEVKEIKSKFEVSMQFHSSARSKREFQTNKHERCKVYYPEKEYDVLPSNLPARTR